jgi:hypothetical protein
VRKTTTSRAGGTTAFSAPASAGIFASRNEMPFPRPRRSAVQRAGRAQRLAVDLFRPCHGVMLFHDDPAARAASAIRRLPLAMSGSTRVGAAPSRQPFLIMGATPSPHSPVNQKRTFRKRGNRRQLQALDLMKQASIGLLKKERRDL